MKRIVIEISFGKENLLTMNLYIEEKEMPSILERLKNNKDFINYLNNSKKKYLSEGLQKENLNSRNTNEVLKIYYTKLYFKDIKFDLSIEDS